MKRFLTDFLALISLAGLAIAEPNMVPLAISTVPTNAAAQTIEGVDAADVKASGWLDTLIFDVGGYAGPTVTVTVVTAGSEGNGPARTLFTKTGFTADAIYPVRDLVCGQTGTDIANVPARSPILGETLKLVCYAANVTNAITLKCYAVLSDTP